MRLVDADALLAKSFKYRIGGVTTKDVVMANNIKTAPTIDAVEVVRCKDCKNMLVSDKGFRFCNVWCKINGMGDDGYCNYGERRKYEP